MEGMDMKLRLFKLLNIPVLNSSRNAITYNRITVRRFQLPFKGKRAKGDSSELPCQIRLAYPPDYENVVKFMSVAYLQCDPVMIGIGTANLPAAESLVRMLQAQVEEGMTMIALSPDNCLIGAAVNAGSCPWDAEKAMEFARCCECGPVREVIEFFACVTSKPNLWQQYGVHKIFECSSLAVDQAFQGRGIGRRLLEESWCLARDCGYRLFRIDCTSRYSAMLAENFKWQKVFTLPYSRYVKNGQMVFNNIVEPHTEVRVYVDPLTYCASYYPPYRVKTPCKRKK